MKKNILPAIYSFLLALFIIAGPTVFLANLLIYYSYMFFTISGLIVLIIIFITLITKFYLELTKQIFETKVYLKNAIIMFVILEITLMIVYPRIF